MISCAVSTRRGGTRSRRKSRDDEAGGGGRLDVEREDRLDHLGLGLAERQRHRLGSRAFSSRRVAFSRLEGGHVAAERRDRVAELVDHQGLAMAGRPQLRELGPVVALGANRVRPFFGTARSGSIGARLLGSPWRPGRAHRRSSQQMGGGSASALHLTGRDRPQRAAPGPRLPLGHATVSRQAAGNPASPKEILTNQPIL